MTEGGRTSKIRDVKETVCGVVEIMRQIRAPGLLDSFENVTNTAKIAKEVIEALKTPEMVKNIENFRIISENISEVTTKMQSTLKQLEETGAINETRGLIKSAKETMTLFGQSGQDLHEITTSIKEVFKSIRAFVDELKMSTVS